MSGKYYTITEIAELLGVGKTRVRQWIEAGELAVVNVSTNRSSKRPQFRITPSSLERFEHGRLDETPFPRRPRGRPKRTGEYVPKHLTPAQV